jgi:hypothetical protein
MTSLSESAATAMSPPSFAAAEILGFLDWGQAQVTGLQQLRQLGDIGADAPGLVAGEEKSPLC